MAALRQTGLPGRPARALGLTLIELLVTLTLLVVLLTLGAPGLMEWRRDAQLGAATSQLVASLNMARAEALRNNGDALLEFIRDDTGVIGWRVYLDSNYNRQWDRDVDDLLLDTSLSGHGRLAPFITITSNSKAGQVVFNGSGFASQSAQTITLSEQEFMLTLGDGRSRKVIVSMAGRIRSCRVGDSGC